MYPREMPSCFFLQLEYELVLKKISKSRTNAAARFLQDTVKATQVKTLRYGYILGIDYFMHSN